MSKSKNKWELTPAEFRELIQFIDLKSITLDECSVKTGREKVERTVNLKIKDKTHTKELDDNNFEIIHSYELVAYNGNQKEYSLKVKCNFRCLFTLKEDSVIPPEFWDIFCEINLPVNTWPYFREFVNSMTNRVDLPPLTLPFFKQ